MMAAGTSANLGAAMVVATVLALAALPHTAAAEPARTLVTAPTVLVTDTGERSATTGAEIVEISIRQRVAVGDLDLSTAHGVDQMHSRVSDTARQLCAELDRRYPQSASFNRRSCVSQAVAEALDQVALR